MSKKNNVNPDYYKQRGRDRVNEDVVGGKGAPSGERDIRRAAHAAEKAREQERQEIERAEKQLDRKQDEA